MKPAVLLAVALAALLAGAVVVSRALVAAPVEVAPPSPEAAVPPPVARPEPPRRVEPPPPPPPPLQLGIGQVEPPPPTTPPPPPPEQETREPDGTEGLPHNRVVEEAWALVNSDAVTIEQARAAAEVFHQCLRDAKGADLRCTQGLKLAHRRQIRKPPWNPNAPTGRVRGADEQPEVSE